MKMFILSILMILSFFTSLYSFEVPSECRGKIIKCTESTGSCTAMNCPTIYEYDDSGKLINTRASCHNTCSYIINCSCDGYYFEIRGDLFDIITWGIKP